jgi:hypothetical protein
MWGQMRVCEELMPVATKLIERLREIPSGIDVMSVRVDPRYSSGERVWRSPGPDGRRAVNLRRIPATPYD